MPACTYLSVAWTYFSNKSRSQVRGHQGRDAGWESGEKVEKLRKYKQPGWAELWTFLVLQHPSRWHEDFDERLVGCTESFIYRNFGRILELVPKGVDARLQVSGARRGCVESL